jgi:hypothetical protein
MSEPAPMWAMLLRELCRMCSLPFYQLCLVAPPASRQLGGSIAKENLFSARRADERHDVNTRNAAIGTLHPAQGGDPGALRGSKQCLRHHCLVPERST